MRKRIWVNMSVLTPVTTSVPILNLPRAASTAPVGGRPKPICISTSGVMEILAPLLAMTLNSSAVRKLAWTKLMSSPSKPCSARLCMDCGRGPCLAQATWNEARRPSSRANRISASAVPGAKSVPRIASAIVTNASLEANRSLRIRLASAGCGSLVPKRVIGVPYANIARIPDS
jgi:hypothetical protein